jgi:hypothetical protein
VELTTDEEFRLVDTRTGEVLVRAGGEGRRHYWTLESDYKADEADQLDWVLTNINDAITPALSLPSQDREP